MPSDHAYPSGDSVLNVRSMIIKFESSIKKYYVCNLPLLANSSS